MELWSFGFTYSNTPLLQYSTNKMPEENNNTSQPIKKEEVSPKTPPNKVVEQENTTVLLYELWRRIKDQTNKIMDIETGMDQQKTINSIMSNKEMRGANVWLLIAAIMVASIGLDTNSQAVIIGAMLISPLMSPILGIGLSVGINNRQTLYISLQHFGIAILVSLVTSFLYFKLTPFASGEPTEQIIARTAPTFLDVLIAFFGGLAGIVSGTRKEQSNAIPGVAIATALLPPLCVSGYGLAKGDFFIFINSFYLFFINSVFVALATYIIVRFLDFPYKEYVNILEKKRSKVYIVIFVIAIMVPSAFIFYNVVQDIRRQQGIEQFVEDHFDKVFYEVEKIKGTDSLELEIFSFNKMVTPADSIHYIQSLPEYNMFDVKLSILTTRNHAEVERNKKTADQNDC